MFCRLFANKRNKPNKFSFTFELKGGTEAVTQKCSWEKVFWKHAAEHPCQSVISIKLICNFIEIALRHWCSPVNLLHIFRTSFSRNTSGGVYTLYMLPVLTWKKSKIFCVLILIQLHDDFRKITWFLMPGNVISCVSERMQ